MKSQGFLRKHISFLSTTFLILWMIFFSGSSYGVIRIDNIVDLQKIGNDPAYPLDGEYELTQDIDASDTINWNGGAGFDPIGNEANLFTGKFNGKGYKIQNLYINRSEQYYVGLFKYTSIDVILEGIKIENAYIYGQNFVGGLVGYNKGTISECYFTRNVFGYECVGGLAGYSEGTVSQCYSTGSVFGYEYIGGLLGDNKGTVSQCYYTGSVYGGDNVGGLLGYNGGMVLECYYTGSVYGDEYVGGLLGYNEGTILECYSTGSVSGGAYVGGLAGYNGSIVSECYSTGSVSGYYNVGGLLGYNEGTVSKSYWDVETSGQINSAGGEGKTTVQMKQEWTFVGWDFTNVWDIQEEVTYPWLRALGSTQTPPPPVEKEIWSLAELAKIGQDCDYPWDGHYRLMVDIDASETINWNEGKGFSPINSFTGIFDGNGHVIQNLYINRPAEEYIGLFGRLWGEVRNLGMLNNYFSGQNDVGGLVGYNEGTVLQCYSTGSVFGESSYVGGLVGYVSYNNGTVLECYSRGSVSGYCYVGGLVGLNEGTVSECYSTGSMSGDYNVGGLVGYNNGTVSQCYSTGSVSGDYTVGGLAGVNYGTVSQCYSTGSVFGGSYVGGLAGYNDNMVLESYWDVETSGQGSSAGGEGKTTAQMKQLVTFVDWDFLDVWGIVENETYPYLKWQYVVPDVVGIEQSLAEGVITGSGLTVGTVTEQCSNTVPMGYVLSQDPLAGQIVPYGNTVEIVVSSGPCPVEVPDVVGMEQSLAEGVITGVGLTVGAVTEQCSDTVPAGYVLSQDPLAGQIVLYGNTVELVISSGLCLVEVPNIVGMEQSMAENTLTGMGLSVGIVTEECSDSIPAGSVISQNPPPGIQLSPGAPVDFSVSTGPCYTTVPYVVGASEATARINIQGAGLRVGVVTYQCSNSVPAGNVISQSPSGGTQVGIGTAVDIVVSTGACPEGEGVVEGTSEGVLEGEGTVEGEGSAEGTPEGISEGTVEGTVEGEGVSEGEGIVEGTVEGIPEGTAEGTPEGEGTVEGTPEGSAEGEGTIEGEGSAEGLPEGEKPPHSADPNGDWIINLSELLRVIQFFNFGGYHCALPGEESEDGYIPGLEGDKTCTPHSSDYNPQDWTISLSELLRLIQFFNFNGYHLCNDGEDGYCPGLL